MPWSTFVQPVATWFEDFGPAKQINAAITRVLAACETLPEEYRNLDFEDSLESEKVEEGELREDLAGELLIIQTLLKQGMLDDRRAEAEELIAGITPLIRKPSKGKKGSGTQTVGLGVFTYVDEGEGEYNKREAGGDRSSYFHMVQKRIGTACGVEAGKGQADMIRALGYDWNSVRDFLNTEEVGEFTSGCGRVKVVVSHL